MVLLVGALISGVLIPAFTRRRHRHQKALEIKTQLVSDSSKSIMRIVVATQFARLGARSQSQDDFDRAYRDWEVESAVIGTTLVAYFPDTTIPADWVALSELVTGFYALEGIAVDARSEPAAALARRLGVSVGPQGAGDWLALKNGLLTRKAALTQQILSAEISVWA